MRAGHASGRNGFVLVRRRLVQRLKARGIRDARVLAAFEDVPRHDLVPEALWGQAYKDTALPIGEGQTISAPGIVATMTAALGLTGGESILEVGTGSGYAAAVLAELGTTVITVERDPGLASTARGRLDALGYSRVEVIQADGSRGCPDRAPFDAITVAAAAPSVPEPLVAQLQVGGRLVVPVGGHRSDQRLVRVVRTGEGTEVEDLLPVAFVPLVGRAGWPDSQTGLRRGPRRRSQPQ